MANCLEMLPFLQRNMSQYIKDPSENALQGDEALLNADEELLMFLEEVVIYTFQQTVYHLTKVLKVNFISLWIVEVTTCKDVILHLANTLILPRLINVDQLKRIQIHSYNLSVWLILSRSH